MAVRASAMLVRYYLEDVDVKGACTRPGTLELHSHALARAAELPDVRERETWALKQSGAKFAARDIRRLNTARDRWSKSINWDVPLAPLQATHASCIGKRSSDLDRIPLAGENDRGLARNWLLSQD